MVVGGEERILLPLPNCVLDSVSFWCDDSKTGQAGFMASDAVLPRLGRRRMDLRTRPG